MNQNKLDLIKHFVGFCKKELNIQSLPHVSLIKDKSFVEQSRSYGEYNPSMSSIKVFYAGRNLADVCRSLAHELTHHRQQELGMINDESGSTGSNIENDANAMAGIIMREYGKLNLSIYDLNSENTVSLTERKQVGTLYHFTNYYRMTKIVERNFILTSNIQPSVSFTRNKQMKSNTVSQSVRITLNGTELSDKYSIRPYADTKAGYGRAGASFFFTVGDESEERVDLKKYPAGVDISKYVKMVDVMDPRVNTDFDDEESFEPPTLEYFYELIQILKEKKIPYSIVKSFK